MKVTAGAVIAWAACASSGVAQERPGHFSLLNGEYIQLGALADPGAVEFAGIVAAVLLPEGVMVVADGGNHVIHWIGPAGELIRSVGREGRGPGEFRGLHWTGACPGGELLTLDPLNGRATFLDAATGRVIRSEQLPPPSGFSQPLRCESDGHLLLLMDRPTARGALGRVTTAPANVMRLDLTTGAVDTLLELAGTEFYFGAGTPGYTYLPLGARSLAATGGHYLFAASTADEAVWRIDLRSGDRSSISHGLPRARVTRELWNVEARHLIEGQPLERTRQLLSDVLSEAEPPDRAPAFVGMFADRAGRLWLRVPGVEPTSRWIVLGGHRQEEAVTVTLPRGVEPLDLRDGRLAAVARDSLGVQSLRIYTLPEGLRAPPPPRP